MADKSFVLRMELENGTMVVKGLDDIGAKGETAAKRIQRAVANEATPGMRGLNTAISEGGQILDGYVRRSGPFGSVLASMGKGGYAAAAGLGATAAAAVLLTSRVKETLKQMDDLADAGQRLNIGVEALQALRLSARDAGFEMSDADTAVNALRENRLTALSGAKGSQAKLKIFGDLGIDRAALMDLENMEALLDRVGAGARAMGNETEAAARLMKLGLTPIAPALMEIDGAVADQIARWKALGLVFDEEIVQRGAEAQGQMELLGTKMDVALAPAFVRLGEIAIPVLEKLLSLLAEIVGGIDVALDGFGAAYQFTSGNLMGGAKALQRGLAKGGVGPGVPQQPFTLEGIWDAVNTPAKGKPPAKNRGGDFGGDGNGKADGLSGVPVPMAKPDSIIAMAKAFKQASGSARELRDIMSTISDRQDGLNLRTDAFNRLLDGSVTSAGDLLDLMVDILRQMIQMAAQKSMSGGGGFFDILGNIVGSFFGGGGGLSSPFGASGNMFSGGGWSLGGGRAGGGPTEPNVVYRWQETNGEQYIMGNRHGYVQTPHSASAMASRPSAVPMAERPLTVQNIVHNNVGADVEQRQSKDSNGNVKLETILNPKIDARMKENIQNGRADRAQQARTGLRPRIMSR